MKKANIIWIITGLIVVIILMVVLAYYFIEPENSQPSQAGNIFGSTECSKLCDIKMLCGSDGKDYCNKCQAEAAGVTIVRQGTCNPANQPLMPKIGGNDSHGCAVTAGYSWCEVKQKCLRSWEEKCQ